MPLQNKLLTIIGLTIIASITFIFSNCFLFKYSLSQIGKKMNPKW